MGKHLRERHLMDVISSEAVLSDLRSRLPPVTCWTCKKVLKRGEHRLMKSHLSRCNKIEVYRYNWSFVARHFKVPAEVRRWLEEEKGSVKETEGDEEREEESKSLVHITPYWHYHCRRCRARCGSSIVFREHCIEKHKDNRHSFDKR